MCRRPSPDLRHSRCCCQDCALCQTRCGRLRRLLTLLPHRVLGSFVPRQRKIIVRIGQTIGLLFMSIQCLGTLIRTTSRRYMTWRQPSMEALTPGDAESFWMCVGSLGILAKSWLSVIVNVDWKSDDQRLPISLTTSLRSQRRQGLFGERDSYISTAEILAEIFLDIRVYVLVQASLWLAWMIFVAVLSRDAFVYPLTPAIKSFANSDSHTILYSWIFLAVPAVGWLRKAEAEAIPGGKEVFVGGYFATLIWIVPRIILYGSRGRWEARQYWVPLAIPWPFIVCGSLIMLRFLLLRRYRKSPSSRISKTSHIWLAVFCTALLVVIPAYLSTLAELVNVPDHSRYCPDSARPDPFWTPSF